MARKPKPIEVGKILCRHDHGPEKKPITARVKKSLVNNKLFIDCPGCGLIMPTLPNMQEHIKNNAKFNEDFQTMYGDGQQYLGGGQQGAESLPENSQPETSVSASLEQSEPGRTETTDRDDVRSLPAKVEPVVKKRSFEDEMGF